MRWSKTILFLLGIFFSCLSIAKITVGIPTYRPPYVISPTQGFDIQIMQTICKRLNEECVFKSMEYNDLGKALMDGVIDVAVGAITISNTRLQNFIFSLPYKPCHGDFVVNDASNIKAIADTTGKSIGVLSGSELEEFLNTNYNKSIKIVPYEVIDDLFNDLINNKLNSIFIDRKTAHYWQQSTGFVFRTVGESIPIGKGFGIMTMPKNAKLIEEINKKLLQIENDGTYVTIYNLYFQ